MSLPGEIEIENRPSIEAKALRINLNSFIYGTLPKLELDKRLQDNFLG